MAGIKVHSGRRQLVHSVATPVYARVWKFAGSIYLSIYIATPSFLSIMCSASLRWRKGICSLADFRNKMVVPGRYKKACGYSLLVMSQ